ncbi:MAG TPA: hypothetical protein VI894_00100 [Candidatus Nanoarchaeia archaeon]|nr:hypothetical protein [Candidatus Nanoarchaeia archaeon]
MKNKQSHKQVSKKNVFFYLLLFLPFIMFLFLVKYFFFFTVDDAFINFRYSENLVLHNQLNWNIDSSERVEGYTNFLWVIIGFVMIKLGLNIVFWSKALGALFGLFSMFFLYLLSKKILKSEWLALIPMFLFALTPAFSFWSISGLETPLFIFLLILSVYLFLIDLEKNTPYSPWAFSLLALTRPEGAVLFVFSFFYLAFFNYKKMRIFNHNEVRIKKLIRRMLLWALPFIIIYGSYFMWRLFYYGNFFPNTFYAKKMLLGGLSDILMFNKYAFIFILLAIFLFAFEKRKKEYYYLAFVILFLNLTVLNIRTVMGFNFRFLVPTAPLIYLLATPSIDAYSLLASKIKGWKRAIFALFLLLLLIYPLSGFFPFNNTKDTMMSGAQRWTEIEHSYEKIGRYLNQYQDKGIKIAIGDAGGIPYYSKLKTIDLLGLNDNILSRNRLEYGYVLSKNPEIIMLINDDDKSFENNYDFALSYLLVSSAEFKQNYELKAKYKTSRDIWLWIYYSKNFKEEFELK